MNAKVSIDGSVGAAVNAETGATVHIHVASGSVENRSEQEVNRAVGTLLRTCTDAGCKLAVERISLTLFGSGMFKTLNLEQLLKLQRIAEELAAQAEVAQTQINEVTTKLHLANQENIDLRQQGNTMVRQLQAKLAEQHAQLEKFRQTKASRPLCQTCTSATATLTRTRRNLILTFSAMVIATLVAMFFVYQAWAARQAAAAVEARLSVCEYGGQPYALGSVITGEGTPDLQCVSSNDGRMAWLPGPQQLKSKRKR